MSRFRLGTLLASLAVALPCVALAQDDAAVRQAVLSHYAAIGANDLDTILEQHTPHFTGFLNDDGLLYEMASRQEQKQRFEPFLAAGWKWNVDVRHLKVELYGKVAVASFYLVGTLAFPGEDPRPGTWRVSEVWVKEGSQWLEVHHHDSPLVANP